MQLRKMAVLFAALSAVLTGCPEDTKNLTCTDNTQCLESEICHPDAKVCVQTCTSSADCPDTAKTCEAVSASNTQKICKCSTDALCNQGREMQDLACDPTAKVCVPKCTADADCATGQTCDTTAGVCKPKSTTGQTCSGTGQSICSYGEFCNNGTCATAPVAPTTCENFSQNRPQWSSATSSGPVIYSVERAGYQANSSFCQASAPDAFLVRVRAYRTDTNWPDTRAGLSGFFYVNTGSQQFDIVNQGLLVPNTGYNRNAANPKDAEFNVYLCRPSTSQTIQTGFYFTGGNPVCSQINR
jgi:hypothetical protein